MYQIVGQIVNNNQVIGFMVFDYSHSSLLRATFEECLTEIKKGTIINAEVLNGQIGLTDGVFSKLPVYDFNGTPAFNSLPVILERVVNNEKTVGYTLIVSGVYTRLRTADILTQYSEFYNAKVIKKDNMTYLSAKHGTFKVLKIGRGTVKGTVKTDRVSVGSYIEPNSNDYAISVAEDFDLTTTRNGEVWLIGYRGRTDGRVVIPEGVTHIHEKAFADQVISELVLPSSIVLTQGSFPSTCVVEKLILPSGIKELKEHAFSNWAGLRSVVIPDSVTKIQLGAFRGCTGLVDVTLPNSITMIADSAFEHCISLKSIVIPSSVIELGVRAFYNCTGLSHVKFCNTVTGSSNLREIGDHAFEHCSSLEGIIIPNGVTAIGRHAFETCSSLKSVTISNSVTRIKAKAFKGCSGLVSIVIPDGVESIDEEAFMECTSLTNIVIPKSVTEIWGGAFKGCNSLKIKCDKGSFAEYYATYLKDFSYGFGTDDVSIEEYFGDATDVIIPSTICGRPVTEIYEHAFQNCTHITSVILPDSLECIEFEAFSGCTGLKSIHIPKSVAHIGEKAFYNCTNLENIELDGCTFSVWSDAFHSTAWERSQLSKVSDGIIYMGDSVFKNYILYSFNESAVTAKELTIKIKDGTRYIARSAFDSCKTVALHIYIPATVTYIDSLAFADCTGLKSITFLGDDVGLGDEVFLYMEEVALTVRCKKGSQIDQFVQKEVAWRAKEGYPPVTLEYIS